ncbi:sensor histidine kinase [Mucilaginibacter sp.]|uniref:sensor histidine kinase n=1 Tax=Mucilaginibacter sp. TaxID=1882438 RepID=UPI003D0A9A13
MFTSKQEIFNTVELISIFFILLISIIIITAILYHNRKRTHKIEVANFQNILIQSQLEVQEQTMQTIGADLHDNIGQLLSLTSLTLNSIELDNELKAKQKIDAAIDLTVRSIKEMRQLGKLLQGDQLIVLGLAEAIRHEINWVERSGKFKVTYVDEGEIPAVNNPDKDLIIFRIMQEAINNIIKHAFATEINIKLGYIENKMQLLITDNGVGFDTANMPSEQLGMGLQNIRKRAGIIGGEVAILSTPGKGTKITIYIPYP